MRYNSRGFTLVELLVVIVILGILTGISIPIIRNIQENNTKKEYTSYMESMKYSAKLYVNSYEEDLFGRKKSGCAIISYESMKERGLLKDIPLDDVSCDTKDTFVKVVKLGDKYGYAVSIGCGKKGSGEVPIDVKDSLGSINDFDSDICSSTATSTMSIVGVPAGSDSYLGKRANMNVRITSNTGILNNANIQYGFSTAQDTNVIDGWKTLPISIMGLNDQRKKIEKGESISLLSDKIITPENQNGSLYLVLRVNTLQDLYEYVWSTETGRQYAYFGPYKVDNTNPTCSTSKSNLDTEEGVTVSITCSDSESGCSSDNTLSYTKQKVTTTYNVKDKVDNTGSCTETITSYDCHPYDCNCQTCGGGCKTTANEYMCVGGSGTTCGSPPPGCMAGLDIFGGYTIVGSCCTEEYPTYPCCDTCYKTCYK